MSEDAHSTRPEIVEPETRRWFDDGAITWMQVFTTLGWKKISFLGDPIEAGDKHERLQRYDRLWKIIYCDWGFNE